MILEYVSNISSRRNGERRKKIFKVVNLIMMAFLVVITIIPA